MTDKPTEVYLNITTTSYTKEICKTLFLTHCLVRLLRRIWCTFYQKGSQDKTGFYESIDDNKKGSVMQCVMTRKSLTVIHNNICNNGNLPSLC